MFGLSLHLGPYYTQRQKLSTSHLEANFFRGRLCGAHKPRPLQINIYASCRDRIVEQSCYFAILCDSEFNKKHMGFNLFSLQHCEDMSKC